MAKRFSLSSLSKPLIDTAEFGVRKLLLADSDGATASFHALPDDGAVLKAIDQALAA
jgi:hypothetical protein